MAKRKVGRAKDIATILGGDPVDRKVPHKARPFPEIIDETDWDVKEGRYPSYIKRSHKEDVANTMQVPLGDTAIDRKIRLHEQAHVAWTPPIRDDDECFQYVEKDTLNATEDARIIELMNRRDEDWRELNQTQIGLLTPQMENAFADGFAKLADHLKGVKKPAPKAGGRVEKEMNLVEAARLIASTRGYAEGGLFDQMAQSCDMQWVTQEVNKMHREFITSQENPTFDHAVAYAEHLEYFFTDKQRQIEEQNEAMAESGLERGTADAESKGTEEVYTPESHERRDGFKQPDKPRKPDRTRQVGNRWGTLTIVHKKLPEKLAARHARRPRPTDSGAIPRYMHRLVSDQRVFSRRRKKKAFQGTVLIDCSGSMSLSASEVDEILRRWPAVTVATYCGSGEHGELWIVASKGKRATKRDLHPNLGGNVVDGPCLDWLSKQKMPRVWISDGGVSGIGDNFGNAFYVDAAVKMKRGKIKRLANVHDLLGGNYDDDDYYSDDVDEDYDEDEEF